MNILIRFTAPLVDMNLPKISDRKSVNLSFFYIRISNFDLTFAMKLLSSLIGVSLFFDNAYALTDDEISAFSCREGIYFQYEKVASNGGTAINQRATSKFTFCLPIFCLFQAKTIGMDVITIINCLATKMSKNVKCPWHY